MALCLPLAVILGYFLTDPLEPSSVALVGFVFAALAVPLMMKWHHPLLIFSWNAALAPAFVTGQPALWTVLAGIGLFFGILNRCVDSNKRFLDVPSIRNSLLFLCAAVALTAYFTGGMGMAALGSTQLGGKRYFYIFAAAIGYFALTSQKISAHRAKMFAGLFFLSMTIGLVPNIAFFLGGHQLDFIYVIFSPDAAGEQINAAASATGTGGRIFGLTMFANGLLCFLLVRYGIRGVFQAAKLWRAALLFLALVACLMSGFRSLLILLGMVFVIQFYLEGPHRTRFAWILAALILVGGGAALTQLQRLPFFIQRTLSFLPIEVSSEVKASSVTTLEWRLQMWQALLPEVPKYLLKGKGCGIDRSAMYFSTDAAHQGNEGFEWAIVAGDYHNGPLSLIIPFGIWGVIGFGWFVCAALRYLYHQHRRRDPLLQNINTLLLSFFLARLILWTLFVGSFFGDLYIFTGIIGLSVSLNGTVPVKKPAPETQLAWEEDFEGHHYRDDYAES